MAGIPALGYTTTPLTTTVGPSKHRRPVSAWEAPLAHLNTGPGGTYRTESTTL